METAPQQLPVTAFLQLSHNPAALDLSNPDSFDLFLQVRRGQTGDDDPRPLTLLVTGSIFDIPYAFRQGLLELVDVESGAPVKYIVTDEATSDSDGPGPPLSDNESDELFITLSSRASTPRRSKFEYDRVISLRLADHIKNLAVTPGRRYRLQLGSLDLGVKRWIYGGKEEFLAAKPETPPPAKLVAARASWKEFLVVESLPTPPKVSISLSMSPSNVVHRSGNPPTTLVIAITNTGDQPVTVKSSGDQPHITPMRPNNSPAVANARITSEKPPPSLENFSITRVSTSSTNEDEEELVRTSHACTLNAGGGWSRRVFATLEPGEPLIRSIPSFLKDATGIKARMGDEDGEFRLKLRPLGVWWCEGIVDEIFQGEQSLKQLPGGGPRPPLMMTSEDEIVFRLED